MIKNKNISILMIMHSVLGVSLAVILVFLSSCFEATPDPTSFGEETSPFAVAEALNQPYSTLNVENIQKGEFVHLEANQAISGGTRFVTKDTGITVTNRVEQADSIQLTLAFQEIKYSSDGSSESTFSEDTIELAKSSASSLSIASLSPSDLHTRNLKISEIQASQSFQLCEPVDHDSVTFHNLQVSSSPMTAPSLVQNTSFCQGAGSACQIPASSISFDQVLWDGESGEKVRCEFIYSTTVPFLSAQMKKCITLAIPVEGRSVIVTECTEVLNFKFGS